MEHYLESMIIFGSTKNLPNPDQIHETQCALFKNGRITGVLLCSNGHFLAVLEGQPLALQSAVKQTIKNDDKVHTIYKSSISERSYRHWNIHVTEEMNNQSIASNPTLLPKLENKLENQKKNVSSFEKIKDVVAYYYCEYIIQGQSCNDYRLTNIA